VATVASNAPEHIIGIRGNILFLLAVYDRTQTDALTESIRGIIHFIKKIPWTRCHATATLIAFDHILTAGFNDRFTDLRIQLDHIAHYIILSPA
jgi:hypothetical protein